MNKKFDFFFKLEDISPFCGATDTLFRTAGDVSPEFQIQSGQPYLHLAEAYLSCSLRFASGATPADLFTASMVTKSFSSINL